jgi:serine/threonine protein kinase
MTTRQIQLCIRQVLEALKFLHSYNVVHRDIKGANVLFDAHGVVKVSDFGTAKHLNPLSSTGSNRPAGTILYMAPEIMRSDTCLTAADIWSLGCLVIEMASQKHPYHERNFTDGIQVVNAVGIEKYSPQVPERLSPDGQDFVRRCLRFDPSERPSAAALLEHPFMVHVAAEEPMHSLAFAPPAAAKATLQVDTLATATTTEKLCLRWSGRRTTVKIEEAGEQESWRHLAHVHELSASFSWLFVPM